MSVLKFGSQKENDKAKRRGLQPTGEKSTTEVQLQGKKKIIDINRKTLRLIFSQTKRHLRLTPYTFQAFSNSAITTLLRILTASQMREEVLHHKFFR